MRRCILSSAAALIPLPILASCYCPFPPSSASRATEVNRSYLVVYLELALPFASLEYFEFKSADTFDRTWVSFDLWISSDIELYVGVVRYAFSNYSP
jgi:hypothetical protein